MGERYRQCKLRKGNSFQTSWLPDCFAKLGKVLRLRDQDKKWDDGWVVIEVGQVQTEWEALDDIPCLPERK
jgi:hypothetical protein